jgi:hypothetical protein
MNELMRIINLIRFDSSVELSRKYDKSELENMLAEVQAAREKLVILREHSQVYLCNQFITKIQNAIIRL